jgi:YggT family protein
MFIFGNVLLGVAHILDMLLNIYMWIVIFSALISWVNPDPYNPIVKFLRGVTEPAYRPIRRFIGGRLGIIDISPIVVIGIILIIKTVFITSLIDFAYKLKTGGMI